MNRFSAGIGLSAACTAAESILKGEKTPHGSPGIQIQRKERASTTLCLLRGGHGAAYAERGACGPSGCRDRALFPFYAIAAGYIVRNAIRTGNLRSRA